MPALAQLWGCSDEPGATGRKGSSGPWRDPFVHPGLDGGRAVPALRPLVPQRRPHADAGGGPAVDGQRRVGRCTTPLSVWRRAGQHDVVHINSALAPSVTVVRAGLLVLAGRMRGCAVIVHAHGGNIETWLTTRRARWVTRAAMSRASLVVAVWNAGEQALADTLGERSGPTGGQRRRHDPVHARTATRSHEPPARALRRAAHASQGRAGPDRGVACAPQARVWTTSSGCWAASPTRARRPPSRCWRPRRGTPCCSAPGRRRRCPRCTRRLTCSACPPGGRPCPSRCSRRWPPDCRSWPPTSGTWARIVVHGETGLVVPTQSPEQLAAALRKVLEDPEAARRMGRAGRARAETVYSSTATARAIGDLYEQVLAGVSRDDRAVLPRGQPRVDLAASPCIPTPSRRMRRGSRPSGP